MQVLKLRSLQTGLIAALMVAPVALLAQTPPVEAGVTARSEAASARPSTERDLPYTRPGVDMTTSQFGVQPGAPRVTPYRTDTPPVLDAVLDDPVWANAAYINEFSQEAPNEGAPATEQGEVWVAYDDDYLYFAFYAHYSDTSQMRANRVARDQLRADDLFTVYFDTFLDQQRGYDFDLNGYGVQGDGLMAVGRRGGGGGTQIPPADRTWDTLFDTAGQIVEDGYVGEMRIPFKSLRYPSPPEGQAHRWGFQIAWEIKSKGPEQIVWSPMSRGVAGFFTQMGILEGMTDITQSRNIEVMPTFTAIQAGAIDPTQPGFDNADPDPDIGVNVKYGITTNLIADFTVNPDFSQIESDRTQIETNLRFPISFPELRPFFVEGSEIFNISAPVTFVHTRTIVDPDYGAKLSGQLGRFTLGFLSANDVAPGNTGDRDDPAYNETAQTYIARAQYDLFSESNVGVLLTDREFMDGYSRLYGLDTNIRFGPTLRGDLRLVGTDRQAPGDDESVGGHLISARLGRNGRFFNMDLSAHEVSPDFRTDVGFVRRRDQRSVAGDVSYRFWPSESVLVNWGPSVNYGRIYNFGDELEDENFRAGMSFQFVRNISFNADVSRDMELFEGTEFKTTRFGTGGNVNAARYSLGANISRNEVVYYEDAVVGDELRWSLNGAVNLTDWIRTGLNFTHSRLVDPDRNDLELYDIKILRSNSNVQFTERFGLRNIIEYSTQEETFDFNLLFQYRVNAGTVIYAGYDDHYQQADLIMGDQDGDGEDEFLFQSENLRRTNRAIFVKAQYLLRF